MGTIFSAFDQKSVRTASDVATDLLRQSIVSGALEPGTRLKEEDIARELGLSRTPVRKAFLVLEHEGLIQSTRNRGAIVRPYNADAVEELYSVRSRLEALAAQRAAGKMTSTILKRLEKSCARFDSLRAADDVIELIQENLSFHQTIMEAAASPRLGELMRTVTELPLVYKSYHWYSAEQKLISGHYHQQITVALAAGDAERAEKLMRDHILEARDFLVAELHRAATQTAEAAAQP